jgi:hypothetical protein
LVALISGIVLPMALILSKRFKHLDSELLIIKDAIERVQDRSDMGEMEQNEHWLNYYRNEIMKFMERIRVHPERIPTKEHYQAVFDHYEEYHRLGGNNYVDLVMGQIKELYKQHYEAGAWPPFDKDHKAHKDIQKF